MIRCGVQCIATNTSTKQQKPRFTNQTNNQIISQGQALRIVYDVWFWGSLIMHWNDALLSGV